MTRCRHATANAAVLSGKLVGSPLSLGSRAAPRRCDAAGARGGSSATLRGSRRLRCVRAHSLEGRKNRPKFHTYPKHVALREHARAHSACMSSTLHSPGSHPVVKVRQRSRGPVAARARGSTGPQDDRTHRTREPYFPARGERTSGKHTRYNELLDCKSTAHLAHCKLMR